MSRENVEVVRRGNEAWQRTRQLDFDLLDPDRVGTPRNSPRATSRTEDGMAFEVDSRASTQERSEYA
jgi:hypothetical protein